jgi:hypothetical protein
MSSPATFLWDPKAGLVDAPNGEIPAGRQGIRLLDRFERGAIAVSAIKSNDSRFIKPEGFERHELMHEQSFYGYYQLNSDTPPRPLRMFIDELMARAIGLRVHSPRGQPDQVASMEWKEHGNPARALMLYKDGQLLREERGVSDMRPELAASEAECVAAGDLRTTSESKRKIAQFSGRGHERQDSLFGATDNTLAPEPIDEELRIAERATATPDHARESEGPR